MIGNPAPALFLDEFFEGEPVHSLEAGRIHVLAFWATWCAPCVKCLPLLANMQARYPDIVVIGVAVMEEADRVRKFLGDRTDLKGLRIAIERRQPDACEGTGGEMWRRWAEPQMIDAIPVAFVVDDQGRIVWSGNTRLLPDALDSMVSGQWDVFAEAERREDHLSRTRARERSRFMRSWADVIQHGNDLQRQRLLTEFVRECPELELHAKVFFELEYRMQPGQKQSVEAIAAYARSLLSLPAAEVKGGMDEFELGERGHALLRMGIALSNGDPGKRAAEGGSDPELAAVAIEAFRRAEPLLEEQPPGFLAQFDIFVAHALMDCALPAAAAARARRALSRLDVAYAAVEGNTGASASLKELRKEAEALMVAANSSE